VSVAFQSEEPAHALAQPLPADAQTIQLTGESRTKGSALAKIDEEWLRVDSFRCERGLFGSTPGAHEVGARVQLCRDNLVRSMLGSDGEFEFMEKATKEFLVAHETTLEGERERFDAWRKEHPAARLEEFDMLARERGGPLPGTEWRRNRSDGEHVLLVRSDDPQFRFGIRDVASIGYSQDQMGYPAVSFELTKQRQKDFGAWTKSIIGQGMAIVLDDEIVTLATVHSQLPGSGIIEGGTGGFSKEEVKALVALLRLPPLPQKPLSLKVEFLR
jgi:preprotein translocase subunit SecD